VDRDGTGDKRGKGERRDKKREGKGAGCGGKGGGNVSPRSLIKSLRLYLTGIFTCH